MIPYGKQDINQDDIDAVIAVLKSDFLTQGPQVPVFESELASICKVQYAVATNSATSALHIANLALGVGNGDIVWTSPITFVATANSAIYCGATIDFVDIDVNTGNMCINKLMDKLLKAHRNNQLPKVVIPVHIAGQSCPMAEISELAKEFKFTIIEDASHAVGGYYNDQPVGNCKYSDITIFSFHPVKIITSAEGGMALTNNVKYSETMKQLRSHGIVSEQSLMTEQSHGPWYYQQISLGFNYRMTDLQAALGLSQLTRIETFIQQRNHLASKYDNAFSNDDITLLKPTQGVLSAYHLYLILLNDDDEKRHQAAIIKLRDNNICAHVHYIPVHLQPYYANLGFKQGDFPCAEEYYRRVISLPLYPGLSNEAQETIISQVKALL